LEQSML